MPIPVYWCERLNPNFDRDLGELGALGPFGARHTRCERRIQIRGIGRITCAVVSIGKFPTTLYDNSVENSQLSVAVSDTARKFVCPTFVKYIRSGS